MTRENKLALVVGFGLILLVGVLISDHFSTARWTQAAEMSPVIDPLSEVDQGDPELIALRTESDPAVAPGAELIIPAADVTGGPASASPASLGTAPPATIPATLPGERLHYVERGQTLHSICMLHYGNGRLAPQLAAYNRLDDPDHVPAGIALRVPADLGGRAHGLAPAQESRFTSLTPPPGITGATGTAKLAATGAAARTYTVRKNETLSQIALDLLGSSRKWPAILDLNRAVLSEPEDLREGMTIMIPRT